MSRLKTKGRTIGVQLSLVLDSAVREKARQMGTSPGLFLADRIERSWKVDEMPVQNICSHRNRKVIAGGLARCPDCGMTRRPDGTWAAA